MPEPIAYAVETYFTERRNEFERDGTVIYHAPMGMAAMPLYTSEALAQARAEGKAEGMRSNARETMRAEMRLDEITGKPLWFCTEADGRGEVSELHTVELAADLFPEGTVISITEPIIALSSPPADGETRPQPMDSEALFDWLQEHHKSVGVTPALREAYRLYCQASGAKP